MGFGPFDDVRPQMRRRAFDTGDFSGLSIKPEKHTLLPKDLNPMAPVSQFLQLNVYQTLNPTKVAVIKNRQE
jgi:hypothetical protein